MAIGGWGAVGDSSVTLRDRVAFAHSGHFWIFEALMDGTGEGLG